MKEILGWVWTKNLRNNLYSFYEKDGENVYICCSYNTKTFYELYFLVPWVSSAFSKVFFVGSHFFFSVISALNCSLDYSANYKFISYMYTIAKYSEQPPTYLALGQCSCTLHSTYLGQCSCTVPTWDSVHAQYLLDSVHAQYLLDSQHHKGLTNVLLLENNILTYQVTLTKMRIH